MYVEICRIFGKKPTPKEGVGRSNRLGDANKIEVFAVANLDHILI